MAANAANRPAAGGAGQAQANKRPPQNRWTGSHNFGANPRAPAAGAGAGAAPPAVAANAAGPTGPSSAAAAAAAPVNMKNGIATTAINSSPDEQARMHERMVFLLASMIGIKVRVTVKGGAVWSGILSATAGNELGVHLRAARQTSTNAGDDASGPPQSIIFQAKDIVHLSADAVTFDNGPVAAPSASNNSTSNLTAGRSSPRTAGVAGGRDGFRTDTDISGTSGLRDQRELQRWGSQTAADDGGIGGSSLEDEALESRGGPSNSKGPGGSGKWDQFATNERLFGAKTNYQEEFYTTKLDKTGADFREREARAARLAREIESGTVTNAHIAEERGLAVDDSGLDEEDKYSGVLRGANAYVPPGARRAIGTPNAANSSSSAPNGKTAAQTTATASAGTATPAAAKPATSATGSSAEVDQKAKAGANLTAILRTGAAAPNPASTLQGQSTPTQASTTENGVPDVNVTAAAAPTDGNQLVGVFQQFVMGEKEKLVQRKHQVAKQIKESQLAQFVEFSKTFTLKSPMPDDLASILAKDEAKRQERMARKSSMNGSSAIQPSSNGSANQTPASTHVSPNLTPATSLSKGTASAHASPVPAKKASPYALPPIPPFNPAKAAAARAAKEAAATSTASATASAESKPVKAKLDAAAPAFVFRPGAAAFTPGVPLAAAPPAPAPAAAPAAPTQAAVHVTKTDPAVIAASAQARSAAAAATASTAATASQVPVNPFFGSAVPKPASRMDRTLHVKEDFSPFKRSSNVPESTTVSHEWGYSGRPYKSIVASTSMASPALTHAGIPVGQSISIGQIMQAASAAGISHHQQQAPHQVGQHAHPLQGQQHQGAGRRHNIRSPPPSSANQQQQHHMSRSPSNTSNLPRQGTSVGDDSSSQKSSLAPTPIPSSSSTNPSSLPAGGAMTPSLAPAGPPHLVQHQMHVQAGNTQQPQMLAHPYGIYQAQQFPGAMPVSVGGVGGGVRYVSAAGAPLHQQHQQAHQLQHGQMPHIALQQQQHAAAAQQHPGLQQQQSAMLPYPGGPAFVTQVPFSPPAMQISQPMFSPQMPGQIPPNQYMQHVFMAQAGARGGQPPQLAGMPQQQFYYQQLLGQGNAPPQFLPIPPQGMPMPTQPVMYDQSGQ